MARIPVILSSNFRSDAAIFWPKRASRFSQIMEAKLTGRVVSRAPKYEDFLLAIKAKKSRKRQHLVGPLLRFSDGLIKRVDLFGLTMVNFQVG